MVLLLCITLSEASKECKELIKRNCKKLAVLGTACKCCKATLQVQSCAIVVEQISIMICINLAKELYQQKATKLPVILPLTLAMYSPLHCALSN